MRSEPHVAISQTKPNTTLLCTHCVGLFHSMGLSAANSSFLSVVFLNLFAFDCGLILKGKSHTQSSSLFPFSDAVIKLICSGIVFFHYGIFSFITLLPCALNCIGEAMHKRIFRWFPPHPPTSGSWLWKRGCSILLVILYHSDFFCLWPTELHFTLERTLRMNPFNSTYVGIRFKVWPTPCITSKVHFVHGWWFHECNMLQSTMVWASDEKLEHAVYFVLRSFYRNHLKISLN